MKKSLLALAASAIVSALNAATFTGVDLNTWEVKPIEADAAPSPSADMLVLAPVPTNGLSFGVYEVLQGQWEKVMGDRPSFFCNDEHYALRPVECVSFDRALEFLETLSARTGLRFDLPTIEEWIFAAKGGRDGDYTDGSKMTDPDHDFALDRLGRYYYNGGRGATMTDPPERGTAVAGTYPANGYGLFDMLGNVREWATGETGAGSRRFACGGCWAANAKKSTIDRFRFFPDRTSDSPTCGLRVCCRGPLAEGERERLRIAEPRATPPRPAVESDKRKLWHELLLSVPYGYRYEKSFKLVRKFDWPESDGELYVQANGPGEFQRVLFTFPKNLKPGEKVPGVLCPYYRPEGVIARNFETGADQKGNLPIAHMRRLAERGVAAASCDFFLYYWDEGKSFDETARNSDFGKWTRLSSRFNAKYPDWNCQARKVHDMRLVTDVFAADERVDATRLGCIGHSHGGQLAFTFGMIDDRIKAVVASDFGFRLDQTFWESPWYYGPKLLEYRRRGLDNNDLLFIGHSKPFCIVSGKIDDATSGDEVIRSGAYAERPDDFLFLNHQVGHRAPTYVYETAEQFLVRKLRDYPVRVGPGRQYLWPEGAMPDAQAHQIAAMTEESEAPGFVPDDHRAPYLEWFERPQNANGACIILVSGGGYKRCCDGELVQEWRRKLTKLGYQTVSLVYRTPRPQGIPVHQSAWEDGQRAVRLVRAEAERRGFDPERIGIFGMSAGAHLACLLAANSETPAYQPVDALDALPCNLALAVVFAPAYNTMNGKNGEKTPEDGISLEPQLTDVLKFDAKTCPISFHHGGADTCSPNGSTLTYRELRKRGIPAELHLYADLPHGPFGFGRAVEFMHQLGFDSRCGERVKLITRYSSDDDRDESKYVKESIWPKGAMPHAQAHQCEPYIEWHLPKVLKTKAIQIIYSGGGYGKNNPDEYEVAPMRRLLNRRGMAVVTLKYRTPRPEGLPMYQTAWEDLQRAIRVVRGSAAAKGLDPERIGIMGSSAGGHMTLLQALSSETAAYQPVDELDRLACNVQWAVAVYPAYVLSDGADGENLHGGNLDEDVILPEFRFDRGTCPVCFLHGDADKVSAMGSVKCWEKLRSMGVQCDLHTYALRPHSFQWKASPGTGSYTWMERVWEFLVRKGFNR